MGEARLYEQPSWLYQRYWVEKLSIKKIGGLCNVRACTIRRHMKKNNIPSRTVSEAYQKGYGVSKYRNKRWLYKEYWAKGGTLRSIAEICARDRTTVRGWFREFDIPVRNRAETQAKVIKTNRKRCHITWYGRLVKRIRKAIKRLDNYIRAYDERDN